MKWMQNSITVFAGM